MSEHMRRCPRCNWYTTSTGACGTCQRELGTMPCDDLTDLLDAAVRKEQGLAWMPQRGVSRGY